MSTFACQCNRAPRSRSTPSRMATSESWARWRSRTRSTSRVRRCGCTSNVRQVHVCIQCIHCTCCPASRTFRHEEHTARRLSTQLARNTATQRSWVAWRLMVYANPAATGGGGQPGKARERGPAGAADRGFAARPVGARQGCQGAAVCFLASLQFCKSSDFAKPAGTWALAIRFPWWQAKLDEREAAALKARIAGTHKRVSTDAPRISTVFSKRSCGGGDDGGSPGAAAADVEEI